MKVKKVLSRLQRKIIFIFDGINTSLYMKMYNSWLKRNGMVIQGKAKYIHHSAILDGQGYDMIKLSNNVVISLGVTILVHDFAIEAGLTAIGKQNTQNEAHTMKPVHIGENSFIGANVTILGGTEIGKNCIVAAGSVIPGKAYPDDCIIAGNPAKIIGNTKEWAEKKYSLGNYESGCFN